MANATSNPGRLHPQTLGTRIGWLTLAACATTVLVIARSLTPNASGLGTHTQLGLPACGFHELTGLPCPGCGLTTAFVHLAHGAWSASVTAHPLGIPLFLLTCIAVPVGMIGAWRAWPLWTQPHSTVASRAVYLAALAFGVTWLSRLLSIGLEHGAS